MSKLKKQIEKKIMEMEYISCRKAQHEGQDLSMVCLNMQCQGNRILCCHCEETQHEQHHILPLKDYLMQIYSTRIDSITQIKNKSTQVPFIKLIQTISNNNTQHINDTPEQLQTNYLSFIHQLENHKISALKSLSNVKQKFLDQLADIEAKIQICTDQYIQKVKILSQLNFGKLDILKKINTITQHNSPYQLNSLIELYINNYNINNHQQKTKEQIDNLIRKNIKMQTSVHAQTHQQLLKIQQTFKNKINNLQNTLKTYDFRFLPKLQKIITFQDIKFKQFSSVYQWDPKLKSKHFEIDQINNKIIRSLKNTVGCQRFAFMKKIFPTQSKVKFRWAIKINNLAGWISVGIGLRKTVQQAQLKFNYSVVGHGSYMISDNGYSWSHSSAQNNSKKQSFNFLTGDIIVLEFDPTQKELRFRKVPIKGPQQKFILSIAQYTENEKLSPCINMCSPKDEIQIIPVPS